MAYLYSAALFVLITSREGVWLRLVVDKSWFNLTLAAMMLIHFGLVLLRLVPGAGKPNLNASISIPSGARQPFLALLAFAMVGYLLFHDVFVVDGGRSLRFGSYLLFFLTLLTSNVNLKNAAKVFAWGALAMSASMLLQAILVAVIDGNDITHYPRLDPDQVMGRNDSPYVNPFGLGLLRIEPLATYGPFELFRHNSYTTEPKYCALILWTGWVALLYSYPTRKKLLIALSMMLAMGLFLTHAYTSIGVALLLAGIAVCTRYVPLSPAMLLGVFLATLSAGIRIIFSGWLSFSSYVKERADSFIDVMSSGLQEASWSRVGWLGRGFDYELYKVPSLFLHFGKFGAIGLLLHLAILLVLLTLFLARAKSTTRLTERLALAGVFSVTAIYQLLFSAEFITPLYAFLYAIALRLPEAETHSASSSLVSA